MIRKISVALILIGAVAAVGFALLRPHLVSSPHYKIYWFIPDGLRAEPDTMQIYRWAEQGLLPNVKKMMERGTYGYSIPAFPSHTPVNFAALLTGSTPAVNGVSDGPMHIQGYPLRMVSLSGFSSTAKKVAPLPYTLEERGYKVAVLSVPGTTPPELERGITLRGRWGGWGIDFPAVIFQSPSGEFAHSNHENRVFYVGPELTRVQVAKKAGHWQMNLPKSTKPATEVELSNWGTTLFAYIYAEGASYDHVLFSLDKKSLFANVKVGDWSEWQKLNLKYQMQNSQSTQSSDAAKAPSAIEIPTAVKIRVIKLGDNGFFRIRMFYDNLNEFSIKPGTWFEPLNQKLGPMVDFADSYPAQLVHYPEDKQTFLEEARMSFAWHKGLVREAVQTMGATAVIHNIYTSNQMLTSRWWMGYVDPHSRRYAHTAAPERERLMNEVKEMYQQVDAILGEILAVADENTIVIFGSDHGVVPLNQEVRLNDFFASKGWLKYGRNAKTGAYEIDWKNTKVVFLKMQSLYINPNGLDGNYVRASGSEYEKLRSEVIKAMQDLRNSEGEAPLEQIVKWEDAVQLGLDKERVGDLVIANRAGFNWTESFAGDGEIFYEPLITGYKQGVLGENNPGMWTPFMIMGPGVRAGHFIEKPIHHIEQYPTILKLMGENIPDFVEGKPIAEVFAH